MVDNVLDYIIKLAIFKLSNACLYVFLIKFVLVFFFSFYLILSFSYLCLSIKCLF